MIYPTHTLSFAAAGMIALAACGGEGEDSRPLPLLPPTTTTASGTGATGSGGANGTTSASSGSTTATTGVEECGPWPAGTPGLEVGEIMPERSWTGLRPGSTSEEQFDLAEFRKCGGGGVDVLIIDTSAYT